MTTLLKTTFYLLGARDNAFTAWNAIEFKGDITLYFDEVRKIFRIYPISMDHLLSILSAALGKSFTRKVTTRLASGDRSELSIYELEAIADEVIAIDKIKPVKTYFSKDNQYQTIRKPPAFNSMTIPRSYSCYETHQIPRTPRCDKVVFLGEIEYRCLPT